MTYETQTTVRLLLRCVNDDAKSVISSRVHSKRVYYTLPRYCIRLLFFSIRFSKSRETCLCGLGGWINVRVQKLRPLITSRRVRSYWIACDLYHNDRPDKYFIVAHDRIGTEVNFRWSNNTFCRTRHIVADDARLRYDFKVRKVKKCDPRAPSDKRACFTKWRERHGWRFHRRLVRRQVTIGRRDFVCIGRRRDPSQGGPSATVVTESTYTEQELYECTFLRFSEHVNPTIFTRRAVVAGARGFK